MVRKPAHSGLPRDPFRHCFPDPGSPGFLAGIVTSQAISVGQSVRPWIQQQIENPSSLDDIMRSLPFAEHIHPYRKEILQKGGEIVGALSKYLLNSFQAITLGTVNLVFLMFIFLYTTFFFLIDGIKVLEKVLYYLPLEDQDERRMLNKFTSVTRATLKGTAVIGLAQGGLAGLALWTVGIHSALFWSVIMVVLSILPGIGTALVWGPAALFIAFGGSYAKAIGLAAFCGLVVGQRGQFPAPGPGGQGHPDARTDDPFRGPSAASCSSASRAWSSVRSSPPSS